MTLVRQKVRTHCAGDKVARQSGRENFCEQLARILPNRIRDTSIGSKTTCPVQNMVRNQVPEPGDGNNHLLETLYGMQR